MVVHRSRRDSGASRPVGIFPHGPIQGDASCHKNHPGGLPTAVIQHPMGSCFWRIASRALLSRLAVIGRSDLCMVASAASHWLYRRCCSVNLWFVLSGISTESLAIASESHAGGTRARNLRTLHKWAGNHLVGVSDDCVQRHRLLGLWASLGETSVITNLTRENSGRCPRRMSLCHGHGGDLRPCDGVALFRFTRTRPWRPRRPHRHGGGPHRIHDETRRWRQRFR